MTKDVVGWSARCLGSEPIGIDVIETRRGGSGCPVAIVAAPIGGVRRRFVVKVYETGFDDYSRLGARDTARKHALALERLAAEGIPVPRLVARCEEGSGAAIVVEEVARIGAPLDRRRAAATLAHLHRIYGRGLDPSLAGLIGRSRPNRDRIRHGVVAMARNCDRAHPDWRSARPDLAVVVGDVTGTPEPDRHRAALQHGDFFGANIIPSAGTEAVSYTHLRAHETS